MKRIIPVIPVSRIVMESLEKARAGLVQKRVWVKDTTNKKGHYRMQWVAPENDAKTAGKGQIDLFSEPASGKKSQKEKTAGSKIKRDTDMYGYPIDPQKEYVVDHMNSSGQPEYVTVEAWDNSHYGEESEDQGAGDFGYLFSEPEKKPAEGPAVLKMDETDRREGVRLRNLAKNEIASARDGYEYEKFVELMASRYKTSKTKIKAYLDRGKPEAEPVKGNDSLFDDEVMNRRNTVEYKPTKGSTSRVGKFFTILSKRYGYDEFPDRSFDDIFEMNDGDEVVVGIIREAKENPSKVKDILYSGNFSKVPTIIQPKLLSIAGHSNPEIIEMLREKYGYGSGLSWMRDAVERMKEQSKDAKYDDLKEAASFAAEMYGRTVEKIDKISGTDEKKPAAEPMVEDSGNNLMKKRRDELVNKISTKKKELSALSGEDLANAKKDLKYMEQLLSDFNSELGPESGLSENEKLRKKAAERLFKAAAKRGFDVSLDRDISKESPRLTKEEINSILKKMGTSIHEILSSPVDSHIMLVPLTGRFSGMYALKHRPSGKELSDSESVKKSIIDTFRSGLAKAFGASK